MKKIIIRIAAVTLLIGGLAFNFALNNMNSGNQNFDLEQMIKANKAHGEDGGYICWPTSSGCPGDYDSQKKGH